MEKTAGERGVDSGMKRHYIRYGYSVKRWDSSPRLHRHRFRWRRRSAADEPPRPVSSDRPRAGPALGVPAGGQIVLLRESAWGNLARQPPERPPDLRRSYAFSTFVAHGV